MFVGSKFLLKEQIEKAWKTSKPFHFISRKKLQLSQVELITYQPNLHFIQNEFLYLQSKDSFR